MEPLDPETGNAILLHEGTQFGPCIAPQSAAATYYNAPSCQDVRKIFFLWRPFSPFPFSWSVGGVGRPQVHARQPVSLATGRSTISPTLHLYTGPVYRVYDRLARKVIFASKSPGPGIKLETNRADPGFFRAPYPLDQLSSL